MPISVRYLALAAGLTLAGCVPPPAYVANPYPAPPPVRAEMVPPPPVSEDALIWQPGHWDWTGNAYAWTNGMWTSRQGHGTTWQDGYWANNGGVWGWLPAHWI